MTFTTELNKKHVIRVADARSDVTALEVATAMDNIISKNIFSGTGGELVEKTSAQLITTQVDEFDIL
ncbi:MAG: DUF2922 domain-containing protein [Syntrophomonadaceae bacterium]|jgi:hypothetical protein|nr:DUF2922 domain-containing protein [Syntrophomonadaceae bacterium]